MNFIEYIKPELITVAICLYGIGCIIKTSKTIKNKYIPLILTVIGMALSCLYLFGTEGFNYMSVFTGIVQGVICTAGAVYSDQLIKQTSKKE